MQLSSTMSASSRPSLLLIATTTGNVWASAGDRRMCHWSQPLAQWKKVSRLHQQLVVYLRPSAASKRKLTANMRLFCFKTEGGQNLHRLEDLLALWLLFWRQEHGMAQAKEKSQIAKEMLLKPLSLGSNENCPLNTPKCHYCVWHLDLWSMRFRPWSCELCWTGPPWALGTEDEHFPFLTCTASGSCTDPKGWTLCLDLWNLILLTETGQKGVILNWRRGGSD